MPETRLTPIQTLLRLVELYRNHVGGFLNLAPSKLISGDASEQPAGDVDDLYRGAQWWIDLIDSFSQIARSQYVGYAGSEPVNQTIERLIGAIKAQADQVALAVRCGMRGVEVVGVLWDQRDKIDAAVRDLERYSLYPPLPAPGVEPLWDTAEVVERVEAQLEAHRKSQTKRRSPEEEEEARRLGEQLQIKVERHLASFADMGMAVLAKLPTEQQALALKLVADDPPPPADNSGEQPKTKEARRRGPKRKYDSAQDRRISEAWNSGRYITVAELGSAFHLSKKEAQRALDRHRKRK